MGRDPYPSSPNGIPFCKKTWKELKYKSSSGYHVLNSIGINLEGIEQQFDTPNDLFFYLAKNGIVFLNLSYDFIGTNTKIKKKVHSEYLNKAYLINKPIMDKSEILILCGEAKKNKWNNYTHHNCSECIHPDVQNRKYNKQLWDKRWNQDSLKKEYNLKLEQL